MQMISVLSKLAPSKAPRILVPITKTKEVPKKTQAHKNTTNSNVEDTDEGIDDDSDQADAHEWLGVEQDKNHPVSEAIFSNSIKIVVLT